MERRRQQDRLVGGYDRRELGTYALALSVLSGHDVRTSIGKVMAYAEKPSEPQVYSLPNWRVLA